MNDDQTVKPTIDPTTDQDDMANDPVNAGMTQSDDQTGTVPADQAGSGDSANTNPMSDQHKFMSDAAYKRAMDLSDMGDSDVPGDGDNANPAQGNLDDDPQTSDADEGEQAVSGSNPDPDSDDDIDVMNAQVGLKTDNMNYPKELNIAEEMDEAEEYKHTH